MSQCLSIVNECLKSNDTFIFDCPKWASKPPPNCGLYFDVLKNSDIISKLLLDDKPYFLIGRHSKRCDFILDHVSISRFHSAVIYHEHLQRVFLMDLGSTHGTFIGTLRLEPYKPQVLPIDTTVYFGQSTRCYALRKRKSVNLHVSNTSIDDEISILNDNHVALTDLTQYNTALNKRNCNRNDFTLIQNSNKRKSTTRHITFSSNPVEIINPEDVDPSIGRYRNMVQSAFIPTPKRPCLENLSASCPIESSAHIKPSISDVSHAISKCHRTESTNSLIANMTFCSAPMVNNPKTFGKSNEITTSLLETLANNIFHDTTVDPHPPTFPKKIYAKEIWPGKKNSFERSTNFLF